MQCKQCGIVKKDEQLVLCILSNIGLELSFFVSTFHSRSLSSPTWKIPFLDVVTKYLIEDQHKPIHIGSLKPSKDISFLVGETKHVPNKGRSKMKEYKNTDFKPKEYFHPSDGASYSKKDKHQRFDKAKCSYDKKGNHTKKGCTKKTID